MAANVLVLEVTDGPFKGKLIVVKSGESIRVGRTTKAEIAFADTYLSGLHFALDCKPDGARVRDLKSRNGTKLNGEYIQEAELNAGDKVFAGETEFVVRIESTGPLEAAQILARSLHGSKKVKKSRTSIMRPEPEEPTYEVPPKPVPAEPVQPAPVAPEVTVKDPPVSSPETSTPMAQVAAEIILSSFESATPEGRLFHILSNQSHHLMALIDAIRDGSVLEFLKTPGLEYSSLYTNNANATIAPYLVKLPPRSKELKQIIQKGWGHGWGVFLTCPTSLPQLFDYLRSTLMVTMPDGTELFSRFYDPRFFREFFEGCSSVEAEKFFGPISSYFVEDERREILLQYINTEKGPEKKGHLLTEIV